MKSFADISSGSLLLATGAVHNSIGLAVGLGLTTGPTGERRSLLSEMLALGVEPDPLRMAIFWFLFCGFLMMLLGALMRSIERRGHALPMQLSFQLLLLGAAGVALLPQSGIWLVFPQAWLIYHRARRTAGPLSG